MLLYAERQWRIPACVTFANPNFTLCHGKRLHFVCLHTRNGRVSFGCFRNHNTHFSHSKCVRARSLALKMANFWLFCSMCCLFRFFFCFCFCYFVLCMERKNQHSCIMIWLSLVRRKLAAVFFLFVAKNKMPPFSYYVSKFSYSCICSWLWGSSTWLVLALHRHVWLLYMFIKSFVWHIQLLQIKKEYLRPKLKLVMTGPISANALIECGLSVLSGFFFAYSTQIIMFIFDIFILSKSEL